MTSRLSTAKKLSTTVQNTTSSLTGNITSNKVLGSSSEDISTILKNATSGTNVLDGYDNVTYHIKMSVVYNGKEIIMIESGKTDLIIDSFEIDSTIGPTFRTKNINSVEMRMTIREALGVSLFDKLFAVQSLLDMDLKTITYKFELSFKGYNPTSGKIVNNIGGKFTWTTIMTDLNFKIDESGSIYNLSFVSVANTAFSDELGTIQFGGSLDKTTGTLGSILSSLATKMNQQVLDDNQVQRVMYKFKDIPYSTLGVTLPIDVKSPFDLIIHSAKKTNSLTSSSRNNDVSQIIKGTQVSKFIDTLLSNSDDGNALLVGIKKPTNAVLFDKNKNTYAIHHRVIATVSYDLFVPAFNDYMKTVTYTIVPKLTHSTVQSTKQVDSQSGNYLDWSKSKVKSMVSNSIINRKYEYIFTGENTEVYDFVIKGEMTFATNFPTMMGANTSISSVTPGQVRSTQMVANQNAAAMSSLSSAKNSLSSDYASVLSGKNTNINGSINESSIVTDYYNVQSATAAVSTSAAAAIQDATDKRKSLTQKLSSSTSKSKYIDDIVDSSGDKRSIYVPLQFTSQQNDQQYNGSVERSPSGTESIFSTIMNQVYGMGIKDMTDINLSVRYDPYWLGENVSTDGTGSSTTVNLSYDNAGTICNYDLKDMAMLFTFNVPNGFSEKTGVPIIKKDDMFTGLYIVHTVKHRFGGGHMSQELQSVRVMTTSLSTILK